MKNKIYILPIIFLFLISFANSEEYTGTLFKTLGKFSIQNVYLSFLYVSSIEYKIERSDDKENEVKLLNSVQKLAKSSIESLKQFEKNDQLSDNDAKIISKIIDANQLLLDEIDFLSDLIEKNQSGILGKVNSKHKKTWNSIKELLEQKINK
jgi:hypothetical protein